MVGDSLEVKEKFVEGAVSPSGDVRDQQFSANPPGGADSSASTAPGGHGGDPSPQPSTSREST